MKVHIDFETRSEMDLRASGADRYAECPSTEILCMAYAIEDDEPKLMEFEEIKQGCKCPFPINKKTTLIAHNAGFEMAIWRSICVARMGWKDVGIKNWECTAALAATYSMPRSLADAASALNLSMQKDTEGRRVMLKMCKPARRKKSDVRVGTLWHEDRADFDTLYRYCKMDVEVEREIHRALPPMAAAERRMWVLDQTINRRGVPVDLDTIDAAEKLFADYRESLESELRDATDGYVTAGSQVKRMTEWLTKNGCNISSVTKQEVMRAISLEKDPKILRVLNLRRKLSKSSVSKFKAMRERACGDGRIRGVHIFNGAGPGRWTATGFQPQNLPRGSLDAGAVESCVGLIRNRDFEQIEMIFGDVGSALSSCIRAMILAEGDRSLICCDFTGIEARVLAWLAGQKDLLTRFREGVDVYKFMASEVYGNPVDQVTKDQRQVGKAIVLGCGFGMGGQTFARTCEANRVQLPERLPFDASLRTPEMDGITESVRVAKVGEKLDVKLGAATEYLRKAYGQMIIPKFEKEGGEWVEVVVKVNAADYLVHTYRKVHHRIKEFWRHLETAAHSCVMAGEAEGTHRAGKVRFDMDGMFLRMKLPSGRMIHYYDPQIINAETKWGVKRTLSYMGRNGVTGKWERIHTYGGKLAENATQGVAACFLRNALVNLERRGFRTVLHVHDETVAENTQLSEADMVSAMCDLPRWAEGCPISADGFSAKRYRK